MKFQLERTDLFALSVFCFSLCNVILLFNRSLTRIFPLNYLILFVAVACQSYMQSMTIHLYDDAPQKKCVMFVFLIMLCTFIGVSIYSIFTACLNVDIHIRMSIISGRVAGGLAFAYVLIVEEQQDELPYFIWSSFFIFLSLLFVAIDTKLIINE